jgi:cell division initiation protein
MRVLVSKLEEYRKNETSMKDAVVNAQKTCDKMVKEAEAKCTQMLTDANAAAALNAKNADSLIAAEEARVEEAKRAAAAKIEEIQEQIRSCIQALDRIKEANRPAMVAPVVTEPAEPKPAMMSDENTEAVANEISQNLEALVGTADEPAPKAAPKHPVSETTSKFINLQFGRNYDPSNH